MRAVLLALMLMVAALPAVALNPGEALDDPVMEARARAISAELRCLVCQNQSIEDSDADLARELRAIVRERLTAGDSDAAVRDYIVARYGEYVLLNPVIGWHTALLWIAAPLLLMVGIVVLIVRGRRRPQVPETQPMTPEEEAALRRLTEN